MIQHMFGVAPKSFKAIVFDNDTGPPLFPYNERRLNIRSGICLTNAMMGRQNIGI